MSVLVPAGRLRRAPRVERLATERLGLEYTPNLRRIEIDLTWECQLRCRNCDRSCRQAPTDERMTVEQVARFVEETEAVGHKWERIAVLGGEPTLHPDFPTIIDLLDQHRRRCAPELDLVVVTNGFGAQTELALSRLPSTVRVRNTAKKSADQPQFEPFNVAPIDLPEFASADFRNGCWITADCGVGLNRNGYYPCGVAGGIDRVFGLRTGLHALPRTVDELVSILDRSCRYCGHFLRGGVVAAGQRVPVEGEPHSPTWDRAYRARELEPQLLDPYR